MGDTVSALTMGLRSLGCWAVGCLETTLRLAVPRMVEASEARSAIQRGSEVQRMQAMQVWRSCVCHTCRSCELVSR